MAGAFTILTDHMPMKYLNTTKSPDVRLNRLKAQLIGYKFDIVYLPGPKNVVADVLSQNPVLEPGEEKRF